MRDRDALGLSVLVIGFAAAALCVPDVDLALLVAPTFSGVVGAAMLVALIVVLRAKGRRGSALERRCLAVFLALMPTVYVSSWLHHREGARWLGVELLGQLVFVALALAGARRSPRLLAAGIVAHGLLWDSWHFGRAPFIADWYVVACVIVDVAFGVYVATQAGAFDEAAKAARSSGSSPTDSVSRG